MRMKKLFAGVLAGAMVVGCMVVPSSAASSTYSASDSTTVKVSTLKDEDSPYWYEGAIDFETLFPAVEYSDDIELVTLAWNQGNSASWINYLTLALNLENSPWYVQHADVTSPYTLDMDEFADIRDDAITLAASTDAAFTVDIDYTYTAYDDVIMIPVSDTTASSYTVTLTSTSGRTCEVTGTKYVKSGDSKYIEIDVSAIPESESITYEVIYN